MNYDSFTRSATPTALLAEDDQLIRELVSVYLQKLGYKVLQAANGQDAIDIIETLEQGSLDLIVTDLLMPKASGEAVIETACQRGCCDRFIVMSGNPQAPEQSQHKALKLSRFIEKPFTFATFEESLESICCN